MNSPIRERSSVSASVMSSPFHRIWPSVTSRPGWPMITLASVDLPDPLGPINAWISPWPTRRSSPRRISLSPARAWRFRISRSGMLSVSLLGGSSGGGRRAGDGRNRQRLNPAPVRELDELGERRVLKRADDPALDTGPQQLGGAASPRVGHVRAQNAFGVIVDEALHRCDRALQRLDHLIHRDLLRRPRQPVAAVGSAGAHYQPGPA